MQEVYLACGVASRQGLPKKNGDLRTWNDITELAPKLLINISEKIRLCSPSPDTNRARWPKSELWETVQLELSQRLPSNSIVDLTTVRAVIREKQEQLLWTMQLGLAASWSHLYGYEPSDAADALECLSSLYGDLSEDDLKEFEKKMIRAKNRYIFLS